MMIKKKLLFSILFLMTIFVMAACGGKSESNDVVQDQSKTDSTEQVRVYQTVKGDIEIPINPERIVTDFYVGELLSVGANVVGADSDAFAHPFIQNQLENITDLGSPMNIEMILDMEPDLIITMYEDHYEEYSRIAPTLYIPWAADADIYETVKKFGDITGNESEAEEFIVEYEQVVSDAKKKIEGVINENTTFGIYELTPDDKLYVFGANFGRGGQALYHALGLKAPEIIESEVMNGDGWKEISYEVLPEYAADYMFLTVYDPEGTGQSLKKLQDLSIYQNLDAVKNKTFFVNDFDQFYRYDPIAIREQVTLFSDKLKDIN